MEEFEVYEYVRTEKGLIDQIIGFDGALIRFAKDRIGAYTDVNDIVKHSFNIIGLIEESDYVNGYPVIDVYEDHICVSVFGASEDLYEDDIKSIVTKEMFESIKYEVIK